MQHMQGMAERGTVVPDPRSSCIAMNRRLP